MHNHKYHFLLLNWSCLNNPMHPLGKKPATPTNKALKRYSHTPGKDSLKPLFAEFTRSAPNTAPTSVPLPPTATHSTISIEGTIPTLDGDIISACGTKRAPAIPAKAAERQNTNILKFVFRSEEHTSELQSR